MKGSFKRAEGLAMIANASGVARASHASSP